MSAKETTTFTPNASIIWPTTWDSNRNCTWSRCAMTDRMFCVEGVEIEYARDGNYNRGFPFLVAPTLRLERTTPQGRGINFNYACHNFTFGRDPDVGTRKACRARWYGKDAGNNLRYSRTLRRRPNQEGLLFRRGGHNDRFDKHHNIWYVIGGHEFARH